MLLISSMHAISQDSPCRRKKRHMRRQRVTAGTKRLNNRMFKCNDSFFTLAGLALEAQEAAHAAAEGPLGRIVHINLITA